MDEFKLREGQVIKLKRGQKLIPLLSIDVPVEIQQDSEESTQKTYMLKMQCPNNCVNKRGKPITVRMTAVNLEPGIKCGNCASDMVPVKNDKVEE